MARLGLKSFERDFAGVGRVAREVRAAEHHDLSFFEFEINANEHAEVLIDVRLKNLVAQNDIA